MSWCPNCRSEYVNGRETCFDCGAVLVESLDDIQDDAADMYNFNNLSDEMKRRVLTEMQKENLDPRKLLNPAKEGSVDFVAQMIEEENAPSYEEYAKQQEEEEKKQTSAIFVKKESRLNDYRSSACACLIVGIVGLAYVIAEFLGFVDFISDSNYVFFVVMTVMFLGFILAGIKSFMSTKKIKMEADAENAYIKKLDEWIAENLNSDYINDGINQSLGIQELYELRAARIRESLLRYDADMNPSMLEYYVENTYISLFES